MGEGPRGGRRGGGEREARGRRRPVFPGGRSDSQQHVGQEVTHVRSRAELRKEADHSPECAQQS